MRDDDARLPRPLVSGERRPGPELVVVTRRLAAAPAALRDPGANAAAALADLAVVLDGRVAEAGELRSLDQRTGDPGGDRAVLALLTGWVALDPAVRADPGLQDVAKRAGGLSRLVVAAALAVAGELAELREPATWTDDEVAREELARAVLAVLGVLPAGEDPHTAGDAWRVVSTRHRRRVAAEMAAEAQRAAELAKALAEQRAKEAAAQYANY
ncbi:hypothetical protein Cfla_1447 [Cellulomonas flavigena DSM 20109]|uniref:Uncharacterized protein n=1 Tax=Cellulomonas flavigena (strain ATCC 482 / DSM 20109 / BCRC 11376 / JCM 18109 / NBRC 3775 / NCIMB 8073 / NRS 134) TaxID=446466 RepID=D5UD08_CELFN|nr:hypothetical protein [Cellulomonas flavigena]ADG74345.1 hypothetical protein Cfla_1447 [Cellulomonas flavigena DSM 20109]